MRYMLIDLETRRGIETSVQLNPNDDVISGFMAYVENEEYINLLENTGLSHEEMLLNPRDEWIDL